jgi:hypothetical protein
MRRNVPHEQGLQQREPVVVAVLRRELEAELP